MTRLEHAAGGAAVTGPIDEVGAEISDYLNAIHELFKPGAKITLLVRHPSFPDGSRDMVMTDDELPEAIAALSLRAEAS